MSASIIWTSRLWKQYLRYLENLLQGDFGPSYNLPDFTVAELFAAGLPVSIQLGAMALILALVIGGALGICGSPAPKSSGTDYAVVARRDSRQHHPDFRDRAPVPAFLRAHPEMVSGGRLGRRRLRQQGGPGAHPYAAAACHRCPPDAGLDDRVPPLAPYSHRARPGPFRLFGCDPACPAWRASADRILCGTGRCRTC